MIGAVAITLFISSITFQDRPDASVASSRFISLISALLIEIKECLTKERHASGGDIHPSRGKNNPNRCVSDKPTWLSSCLSSRS